MQSAMQHDLRGNAALRIRHIEQYHAFWTTWLAPFIYPRDVRSLLVAIVVTLFAAGWMALMRAGMVEWTQPEAILQLSLGLESAFLWKTVALQLLWGLPGVFALTALMTASVSWGPSSTRTRTSTLSPLLPIGERDLLIAQFIGRGSAALRYIAGGLIAHVLLALLLVYTGVATSRPPLLDSWSLAAIPAFAALFAIGAIAERVRRRMHAGAASSALGLVVLLVWIEIGLHFTRMGSDQWNVWDFPLRLTAGALAVVAVLLAAYEVALRTHTRRVASRTAESAPRRRRRRWTVYELLTPLAGIGLIVPGIRGTVQWLKRALQVALISFGALTLAGGLAQILTLVGDRVTGQEVDRYSLLAGPAIVAAVGMALVAALGVAVWTELLSPRYLQTRDTSDQPHAGLLLPASWRSLWWRRLTAVLMLSVPLTAATVAARIITQTLSMRLGGFPVDLHADARSLLSLAPAMLALALALFATVPLLRPMVRLFGIPSAMPGALWGIGLLLSFMIPLASSPSRAFAGLLALEPIAIALGTFAMPLLMLALSWALMSPRVWSRRPDGRPQSQAAVAAVATIAAMLLGGVWMGFGLMLLLLASGA